MKKKFKIVAVVSARGGSKGIPKKNIKILGNKPLVIHSLQTLLKIKDIDKIILSSDDDKILKVVKNFSKKIILSSRPKKLAKDKTPLTSVVKFEAQKLEENGYKPDFVLQIAPTCPFIKTQTIKKIINYLIKNKSDCVVSLKRIEHDHPYRAKNLFKDKYMEHFIKNINVEKFISRQDLPVLYTTSGAVYGRSYKLLKTFNEKNFCLGKNPMGVVVDDYEAINIDRPIDFEFANFIQKRKLNRPI